MRPSCHVRAWAVDHSDDGLARSEVLGSHAIIYTDNVVYRSSYINIRCPGKRECSLQMPIAAPSMACHRCDRRLGIHLARGVTS